MSAPASHLLAGVVLDVGLKATAPLALALVAQTLLRRAPAATRHAVGVTALLSLPLLAPAVWWGRGQELAVEASAVGAAWAMGTALLLAPLVAGWAWLLWVTSRGEARGDVVRARPGDVTGPLTFGWWRPRVLVPADWDSWPAAQQAAALAHERAHIARRDWLTHVAARVVRALFWFHPLAWLLTARVALAAELAADDRALDDGVLPSDYADALLRLSRARPAPAGLAAGHAAEARIRAALSPRPSARPAWPIVLVVAAMLAVGLPALARVSTWSPPEAPPSCQP